MTNIIILSKSTKRQTEAEGWGAGGWGIEHLGANNDAIGCFKTCRTYLDDVIWANKRESVRGHDKREADASLRTDRSVILVKTKNKMHTVKAKLAKINRMFKVLGMKPSTIRYTNSKNKNIFVLYGDVRWAQECWKHSIYTYIIKKMIYGDTSYDSFYYWTLLCVGHLFTEENKEQLQSTRNDSHAFSGFVTLANTPTKNKSISRQTTEKYTPIADYYKSRMPKEFLID